MNVVRYERRVLASITVHDADDERRVEVLALDEAWPELEWPETPPGGYPIIQRRGETMRWERPSTVVEVPVVLLDLRGEAASVFEWEAWVRRVWSPSAAIVRDCVVRPRALDFPLSFPIRVLEVVSPPGNPWLEGAFSYIFGGEDFSAAFQVTSCSPEQLSATSRREAELEILHFSRLPELSAEELFDITARGRTRLVTIEMPPWGWDEAERLAHELAELGGPAVLLLPGGPSLEAYLSIVHDEPLDFFVARHQAHMRLVFVGGGGREDLMRVSPIVERLTDPKLGRAVEAALAGLPDADDADDDTLYSHFDSLDEPASETRWLEGFLRDGAPAIASLSFDREHRGTLPSARLLQDLRQAFNAARPPRTTARPDEHAPRHVNAVLYHASESERSRLDPEYDWVEPGQSLDLAIQVGAVKERIRTLEPAAFLEEKVRYEEDTDEAVLEVGVTALDFELQGSPVQRVRLPRFGDSDVATFRLRVRDETWVPGVSRLRFCLYHRNALLHSFRVAIAHRRPGGIERELASRFREALDLEPTAEAVAGAEGGYFVRLEYSAADLERLETVAPRRFSFFVNDSAGQTVVTLKGEKLRPRSLEFRRSAEPENHRPLPSVNHQGRAAAALG